MADRLEIQYLSRTRLAPEIETIDTGLEPMEALPLMGRVSAGYPLEAVEDPDWVQVPERLTHHAEFALRVCGDSMTDDRIEDSDLILMLPRKQADDGEIVVALIDGEDATVKRLYRDPTGLIRLQPAHPAIEPLRLAPARLEIIGVVTAVLRRIPER